MYVSYYRLFLFLIQNHWRDQHFIFIFKEIYCYWKFHTNKATTFRMSAPTESDKTKRRNKNLTVEQIQEDSITQVLLGHLNALFGGSCIYNSISVCSALNEKVYTFMFFFVFVFVLTLQWLKNCTKNVSFHMIMVMLCYVFFFLKILLCLA